MFGSLLGAVVVSGDVSTTGGWVAAGLCAGLVLAVACAAVAVAKGRLWRSPEFPEKVEVMVRPPGAPRPIGGAHAAPLAPLWSSRRYRRSPVRIVLGGGLLVLAGTALGVVAESRGNTIGVVLCGLGTVGTLVGVGVRDAWGVLLGLVGVVAASAGVFAGWFGAAGIVVATLGVGLLGVVYQDRDERPSG